MGPLETNKLLWIYFNVNLKGEWRLHLAPGIWQWWIATPSRTSPAIHLTLPPVSWKLCHRSYQHISHSKIIPSKPVKCTETQGPPFLIGSATPSLTTVWNQSQKNISPAHRSYQWRLKSISRAYWSQIIHRDKTVPPFNLFCMKFNSSTVLDRDLKMLSLNQTPKTFIIWSNVN